MPGFPFPGRPGGELDEPLLDMIIARRALPPGAPPEMHDLARMLAALAGPGEPGELAGEVAARAAFIQVTSPAGSSPRRRRPVRHRKSRSASRLTSSRTGMAVALTAAAAGIAVLAAYAGMLPGPVQKLAHIAMAAPSPGLASPPPSPPAGGSLAGTGSAVRPSHSAAPAHQSAGTATQSAHSWPTASAGHQAASDQRPPGSAAVPGCPASPGNSKARGPVATPTSSAYWWQSALCTGGPAAAARPAAPPSLAVPSIPRP